MSKSISRLQLRKLAFDLRCEGMEACQAAHEQVGSAETALKERGAIKKHIAERIERMLDGEVIKQS